MANFCANGIVLSYTDYRDNDRLLTLFTFELGKLEVKAANCRKPTAPLFACAQQFCYGEFELFERNGRMNINQFELKETFYALRDDLDRYALASMACRLCSDMLELEQSNEPMFSLLYHTLSFLAYGSSYPLDLIICFILKYLSISGYCPAITSCCSCQRDLRGDRELFFSPTRGGAVCVACAMSDKSVSATALEAMRRMLLLPDSDMQAVVLKNGLRRELLALLVDYCYNILGKGNKAIAYLESQLNSL